MPIYSPGTPGTRAEQIKDFANALNQQYNGGETVNGKTTIGQEYINYMEAHPDADPYTIYQETSLRLELFASLGIGIGKSLGSFLQAAGDTTNDAGQGIGKGASQFETDTAGKLPSWLQAFLGNNGGIRIAEGVLAIVLIGVGVNALTKGKDNIVIKGLKGAIAA